MDAAAREHGLGDRLRLGVDNESWWNITSPQGEKLSLDFSEGEEQQLVAAAVALDGVVLISWHHKAIPAIKDALVGDHSTPELG